jgi:hypothetical protein
MSDTRTTSGPNANEAWAMLARHHYAQEANNVMHSVMLYAAQCFPPGLFSLILAEAEAGL